MASDQFLERRKCHPRRARPAKNIAYVSDSGIALVKIRLSNRPKLEGVVQAAPCAAAWEELAGLTSAACWNASNIEDRLEKGNDPWSDYEASRQSIVPSVCCPRRNNAPTLQRNTISVFSSSTPSPGPCAGKGMSFSLDLALVRDHLTLLKFYQ